MTELPRSPVDERVTRMLEARARDDDPRELLDAIGTRLAKTSQVSRSRSVRMVSSLPLTAAAAVLLTGVALVVLVSPLGPAHPTPAPPTPTAVPTPAPSPRTLVPGGLDAAVLPAGTWETLAFEPTARFTVPAGIWRPGLDLDQQLFLRAELPGMPADEVDAMTIVRLVNVFVEPCTQGEAAARPWDEPPGGDAFMRWLGQQTDVDLGPVGTVTAFGRPAREIVATLPADAFSDCAEGFLPIGEVFGGPSGIIALPRQGQRFRLTAFDLAGSTYLFLTFGAPERWDELVVATDQLIGTLEFEVGSTP